MKRNFKLCAMARHILTSGLLFPAVVCLCYIAGLFAKSDLYFFYDVKQLCLMTAEIFAACTVVAIACAFFAEWLYRRHS